MTVGTKEDKRINIIVNVETNILTESAMRKLIKGELVNLGSHHRPI